MLEKTLNWITGLLVLVTILFLFLWRSELNEQQQSQFQGRTMSEIYGYASIDTSLLEENLVKLEGKWTSQQMTIDTLGEKCAELEKSLKDGRKKKKQLNDKIQVLTTEIEEIKQLIDAVVKKNPNLRGKN